MHASCMHRHLAITTPSHLVRVEHQASLLQQGSHYRLALLRPRKNKKTTTGSAEVPSCSLLSTRQYSSSAKIDCPFNSAGTFRAAAVFAGKTTGSSLRCATAGVHECYIEARVRTDRSQKGAGATEPRFWLKVQYVFSLIHWASSVTAARRRHGQDSGHATAAILAAPLH